MTHTPGPWIARGDMVVAHRPHVTGGYNEESILALSRAPNERRANARLIAAAPALLEAAEEALTGAISHVGASKLRAAIALAKGENK